MAAPPSSRITSVEPLMTLATKEFVGEDVFAGNVQTQVGASFNTLYAVRRMGVKASHAGVIGIGPLFATQFHPEKSAEAGSQLLRNWIATF